MNRRDLLKGLALLPALHLVPSAPEPERHVAFVERCEVDQHDAHTYTYYSKTNRGRMVDLTPHGNRVPEWLVA